jgi:serine/threonine-protein kinase ATR
MSGLRVCDDDELNLALLHLVECLGHPNSLICGIAFNEVCSLPSQEVLFV